MFSCKLHEVVDRLQHTIPLLRKFGLFDKAENVCPRIWFSVCGENTKLIEPPEELLKQID